MRDRTVVVGSRAVDRDLISNPQPIYRDFMGRAFNLLVRLLVLGGSQGARQLNRLLPPVLAELAAESRTLVFYESAHRILETLEDLVAVFGPRRRACLARELTKLHQEVLRGTVAQLENRSSHKSSSMGKPSGLPTICR